MTGLLLRNGKRSGVEIIKVIVMVPCRNVCVSAQKNVSFFEGRGILLGVVMTVGSKDPKAVHAQPSVICKNRESENHLIDLSFAVSSHAKQILGTCIQHLDYLLGCIVAREVVARAVIKKIAKKEYLIGGFLSDGVNQFLTVICRAVEVRCDKKFHSRSFQNGLSFIITLNEDFV